MNKKYRGRFGSIYLLAVLCMLAAPHGVDAQWISKTIFGNGNVFCIATSGTTAYAGNSINVISTTNSGTVWTGYAVGSSANGLTTSYTKALVFMGSKVFAGSNGGGVFVTTNNATTWSAAGTTTLPVNTAVTALAVSGTNLYASASTNTAGVFLSSDSGKTWNAVVNGMTNKVVSCLGVLGTAVFAGTNGGIFRSTDNGTNWSATNTGLTNLNITSFATMGTNIFVGTQAGVCLSTNNGANWTDVTTNAAMTTAGVSAFAVSGTSVFAISNKDVYLSTNTGVSWNSVSTGLTAGTTMNTLAVCGTNLLLGSSGSIWRRPLSEMITSVSESRVVLPGQLRLEQNFPNPFNPTTAIGYQLSVNGFASLKVYDAIGREVATLVNEVKEAGYYSAQFYGARLSSGIYFAKLSSSGKTQMRKLVLMK